MHSKLQSTSGPNAFTLWLPVASALNISEWRTCLRHYHDHSLCDFLQFGWPVSYSASTRPNSSQLKHGSSLSRPDVVNSFLVTECLLRAMCGPFSSNPLSVDIVTSPLQIAHSRSGKPCVVVNLSFPHGDSVNDGIPTDSYLGTPFTLCIPGVDALVSIIHQKGKAVISSRRT